MSFLHDNVMVAIRNGAGPLRQVDIAQMLVLAATLASPDLTAEASLSSSACTVTQI
jgi:hypothetical protein